MQGPPPAPPPDPRPRPPAGKAKCCEFEGTGGEEATPPPPPLSRRSQDFSKIYNSGGAGAASW